MTTALRGARDPWWIIGSAAVALHGGAPIAVADVDVLCSIEDADAVIAALRLPIIAGEDDPLFRSARFARWDEPPLQVELMAGFHIRSADGWRPVRLQTRHHVKAGNAIVPVPSRTELIDLLMTFGREKDLHRASLLRDDPLP